MNAQPLKQEFRWSVRKKGKNVLNLCAKLFFYNGLLLTLLTGASTAANANPADGVVASGAATITSTASELTVNQATDRAVINWKSFDIANGETTRFVQPGASSVALNRVVNSAQASAINGNLFANGRVLVINPNGVLIGTTGNVDVAGFIASTADIDNASFMNSTGTMNFDQAGNAGAVVENRGQITIGEAGLGLLVAPTVQNSGVIEGKLARIQMGAADTFGVDLYGDGLIQLAVGTSSKLTAQNTGSLIADGGKILMTAAAANSVVESVINTSGVIEAKSLVSKGGEIVLTGAGAHVNVSGTVDASGATGGGSVKIGGDYQGGGTLAHAATTTVTGSVKADATDNGNGGMIVAWSENQTTAPGVFSAQGGANGGNGGVVETSSKGGLSLDGITVDTLAANGEAGNWLIDPLNVTVNTVGGGDNINVTTLNNASSNITIQADNSITFAANVNIGKAGLSLTAKAGTADAPLGTAPVGDRTAGTGTISITNQFIRTNGGAITLVAGDKININNSSLFTRGGAVRLTSGEISINHNAAIGTKGGAVTITALEIKQYNHNKDTSITSGKLDFQNVNINTTGGSGSGGISLTEDEDVVPGTNDQKEAFFGNNNTFETSSGAGKITLVAEAMDNNNNNCFSAGGTKCVVADPIPLTTLTLTAKNQSKTYGNTFTFNGTEYTLTGTLAAGDSITKAHLESAGALATASVGSSPYSIIINNATGSFGFGNYNIVYVNGAMTVIPATLTATLTGSVQKVYDDNTNATLNAGNYSLSGLLAGDVSNVTLNGATAGTYDTQHVGTGKTVTISGITLTGAAAGNYSLSSGNLSGAVGIITARALYLTANTDSRVYNGTKDSSVNPTIVSGLQGDDGVSGLDQEFDSKDVGSRTLSITSYTVNDGNGGDNYTVHKAPADGYIYQASLSLTGLSAEDKIYDASTEAVINTADADLEGETFGTDDVSFGSVEGWFVDKHVGTDKSVWLGGDNILVGADADNYAVELPEDLTADITARDLILSAQWDEKTYDGTTEANNGAPEHDGLQGDDEIGDLTQAFDSKNAGDRITSVQDGFYIEDEDYEDVSGNYNIIREDEIGYIHQRGLYVVGLGANDKVYDGTTDATIDTSEADFYTDTWYWGNYWAPLEGDVVSIDGGTGEFFGKNVGYGKTVWISGVTLGGGDAGNYYAEYYPYAWANITPAPLTITANDDGKMFDGAPYFGGNGVTFSGFVPGEDESVLAGDLTYGGTSQGAVNVGNYTITPEGLTAPLQYEGGDDEEYYYYENEEPQGFANYDITYVDGNLEIEAAPNFPTVFIDALGRPVISVADRAIKLDAPFEPIEVNTLDVDVSIGGGGNSAAALAGIEPAAGGSPEDLANIEPAAGGDGGAAGPGGDVACGNNFLNDKPCDNQ